MILPCSKILYLFKYDNTKACHFNDLYDVIFDLLLNKLVTNLIQSFVPLFKCAF